MNNISLLQKRNLFCVLIIFFICPILVFPIIIYTSIKKYSSSVYSLLAIFMGLVSILWAPTADLYRHNMMYYEFKRIDFFQFLSYIDTTVDVLYYVVLYFFAKMDIHFEFIRFLFVFIAYRMTFDVYLDCVRRNPNLHTCHTSFFLIFYLSISFFTITQGLRYGVAISFFSYGAYFYFLHNKMKWIIYVLLACFIHFSMFPILMVLLLAKSGIKITSMRIAISFFVFVAIFREESLNFLIDALPINDLLKIRMGYYIEGYWSHDFLDEFSIENKISRFLEHLVMYPLLLFSFRLKNDDKYNQFVKLLIVVVGICYLISLTLFFRISLLFVLVSLYAFSVEFGKYRRGIMDFRILLFCCFLSFSSQVYKFRREATISREYLLVCPLPFSFFNEFDYQWIVDNVDEGGAGRNLKY